MKMLPRYSLAAFDLLRVVEHRFAILQPKLVKLTLQAEGEDSSMANTLGWVDAVRSKRRRGSMRHTIRAIALLLKRREKIVGWALLKTLYSPRSTKASRVALGGQCDINVYVHPLERHKGLGTILLNGAIVIATRLGYKVRTWPHDKASKALFAKSVMVMCL